MLTEGQIDEATGRELAPVASIDLWECNLPAFRIFQRCSLSYVGGGLGGGCLGITQTEIAACLSNFRLSPEPAVIDDVLVMGRSAADYLNRDRSAEKAHG